MPGVTRDRRYGVVDWMAARFRVVDTGGLDPSAAGILGAMRSQTLRAIDEADLLLLVLDVVEGVTAVDEDVATLLRRSGKPLVVAANKVDSDKREAALAEIYALGFEDVFGISASHGRGIGDLLDRVVERLGPRALVPDEARESSAPSPGEGDVEANGGGAAHDGPIGEPRMDVGPAASESDSEDGAGSESESEAEAADVAEPVEDAAVAARPDPRAGTPIRIAFVGKPNVGKSSLVNRLLGEERVLVHDAPGTTRDPIDSPFRFGGREFVLVDTAGLRRRRSIDTQTEAVAAKMTRDQLARCDVAVLVIDAREGATVEDAKIAGMIEEAGRACLLILNKKDLVPRAEIDAKITITREVIPFLSWVPVLATSARSGAGIGEIPARAATVFDEASRRIPTGELNRFLEAVLGDKPPPAGPSGRHVRLYYATQASVRPPRSCSAPACRRACRSRTGASWPTASGSRLGSRAPPSASCCGRIAASDAWASRPRSDHAPRGGRWPTGWLAQDPGDPRREQEGLRDTATRLRVGDEIEGRIDVAGGAAHADARVQEILGAQARLRADGVARLVHGARDAHRPHARLEIGNHAQHVHRVGQAREQRIAGHDPPGAVVLRIVRHRGDPDIGRAAHGPRVGQPVQQVGPDRGTERRPAIDGHAPDARARGQRPVFLVGPRGAGGQHAQQPRGAERGDEPSHRRNYNGPRSSAPRSVPIAVGLATSPKANRQDHATIGLRRGVSKIDHCRHA